MDIFKNCFYYIPEMCNGFVHINMIHRVFMYKIPYNSFFTSYTKLLLRHEVVNKYYKVYSLYKLDI